MQIKSILPLAAVHMLGNLLTNVSLGKVAVSFTHTIKVRLTRSSKCCNRALACAPFQNGGSSLPQSVFQVCGHPVVCLPPC